MGLLENINARDDLMRLSQEQLPDLAREIREEIIRVVSGVGGHLASNLGVVELTIALHRVFDFDQNNIFWDVSHQSYTHKILSGRRGRFHTLRRYGGLTGFSQKGESPQDRITAGHAGASISVGLGQSMGDKYAERKARTVVVIGDGSIASGMPFEGMNHAGELGGNLLVILNDNKMSISRPVGSFANYLNRIRLTPFYHDLKKDVSGFLKKIPVFGEPIGKTLEGIVTSLSGSILPGQLFWELGFEYFGPLDGHDLTILMRTLEDIRTIDGPVLLHVMTQKGCGFEPAASDPQRFHSAKGFALCEYEVEPPNGKPEKAEPGKKQPPRFTEVASEAFAELGEACPDLIAITAAMQDGTGLEKFHAQFPERVFDVGICEQHAVGFGAGLASAGRRVLVAIYSTFLQRAFDQVFHDVILNGLPVTFALDRAGLVGSDGPTHHGAYDISYLRPLPGIVLAAPKDGPELKAMLKWAVQSDLAVAVRYPKDRVPDPAISEEPLPIELGRGEVLKSGKDVCLFAYGSMVPVALETAEKLATHGTAPTVVNARFAKPLDTDMLSEMLKSHKTVVTLEENALPGGFGTACLEAAGSAAGKIIRVGLPDRFVVHGSRTELFRELGIDSTGIVKLITGRDRIPDRVKDEK
ncbi:MAG: 1-deoxy-D-xylulose-5-phosphate synthase [Planctomycetota bacterium]|jgi:1-deoxy-D-xylulose-5-phosphate synthase